ncbi:hypothetical protein RB213_010574 [Colletotrichum asianum]
MGQLIMIRLDHADRPPTFNHWSLELGRFRRGSAWDPSLLTSGTPGRWSNQQFASINAATHPPQAFHPTGVSACPPGAGRWNTAKDGAMYLWPESTYCSEHLHDTACLAYYL